MKFFNKGLEPSFCPFLHGRSRSPGGIFDSWLSFREHEFDLKQEKCSKAQTEIPFLGHRIGHKQVERKVLDRNGIPGWRLFLLLLR